MSGQASPPVGRIRSCPCANMSTGPVKLAGVVERIARFLKKPKNGKRAPLLWGVLPLALYQAQQPLVFTPKRSASGVIWRVAASETATNRLPTAT